jgi:hypothetical protein
VRPVDVDLCVNSDAMLREGLPFVFGVMRVHR